MRKFNRKKIAIIVSSLCFTCVCVFCSIIICGCNGFDINKTINDVNNASNTAYLSQVNAVSKDINSALSGFDNDVKNKNVDSMKDRVNECNKILDQVKNIDVPENYKDAQDNYISGLTNLISALDKYVAVFSDSQAGQISNDDLNARIPEIQNTYNQALESLKTADKIASEK